MQDQIYENESRIEQDHWWFVVRRELCKKYLQSQKKDAVILDIGSGSGSNLRLLQEMGFSNYRGFDLNPLAKKFCEEKKLGEVLIGDICNSGLAEASFDVIMATDVIEHIRDDDKVLSEIRRILKPGGMAIITVPCFQSLWSRHDEILMHQRRYELSQLTAKILGNKMTISEAYYFNFFLFFPILLFRKISEKIGLKLESESAVNNRFLNNLFKIIFRFDVFVAQKIKFPCGVSAFVLVQKKIETV